MHGLWFFAYKEEQDDQGFVVLLLFDTPFIYQLTSDGLS